MLLTTACRFPLGAGVGMQATYNSLQVSAESRCRDAVGEHQHNLSDVTLLRRIRELQHLQGFRETGLKVRLT